MASAAARAGEIAFAAMTPDGAIVLITTSYPRTGDGSEAAGGFVADLAVELSRSCKVRVVAPGDADEHEVLGERLEVFRFAAPGRPLSTLRPWRPSEFLGLARVLRAGRRATRRAVQAGPTLRILALWALPSGHWARTAALESKVPYSVWTLGSDIWSLGRVPGVRSWLRRVLSDAQTCYSDGIKLAEDTRRIGGREVEFLPSTRRIEGGREAPLRSKGPYRLLFLGRWHPNKGADLLLAALARLSDEDWALVESVEYCGGGPLEAEVRSAASRMIQAGRPLTMNGFLDKPAAEAAMLRADWLLIPSRIESIPVVFSDAMKLGLPVVSTPVGDLPALVAEAPACGRLAEAADAEAFAAAMASALRTDSSRYAEGVRERAARFDLGQIAARILSGGSGASRG